MRRGLVPALAVVAVVAVVAPLAGRAAPRVPLQLLRAPAVVRPQGVVAGPDGAIWFTSERAIGRISPGGAVRSFASPDVAAPSAIVAGPDGALWFVNGAGSIGRITTAGAITIFPAPTGASPVGLAAGADGALWFTTGAKAVGRMTTDGSVETFSDPARKRGTDGIARGPDGAIWFTNHLGASIGRIDADGGVTVFTDPRIRYPAGIVAGPDGALWFADDSGSIGRITTTGAIRTFGTPGTVGHPFAITAAGGTLWATDRNGSLVRITTSGAITRYAAPSMRFPVGIAAARDGSIWFASYLGDSIGRLTPRLASAGAPAPLPRVTLISDSVAAAIAFDVGARATLSAGIDLFLEPGQARRLGGENPPGAIAPPTALQLISGLGRRLGPTVILAVGDNDPPEQEVQNVAAALAALHRAGVRHVIWTTLHVTPDHTSYVTMNEAVVAAAESDPTVTVADWNAYVGEHPEWLQPDGVHLAGAGARGLAQFLRAQLVRLGIPRS